MTSQWKWPKMDRQEAGNSSSCGVQEIVLAQQKCF